MSILSKLAVPIDETDPALANFLNDLQGNILKGHGRDHTVNCFLRFDGDAAAIGAALAALPITSARKQLDDTAAAKAGGPLDVPAVFLFLTRSGLGKLGRDAEADTLEDPFKEGMAKRASLLDDTPADWEPKLRDGIDGMLLVARDAPAGTDNATKGAEAGCVAHADMLMATLTGSGIAEQVRVVGRARRNQNHSSTPKGDGIEQFGYVDGRSQPLLLQSDVRDEPKNGPDFAWDPRFSPAETVLVADPNGAHPGESFGSYFVFRKLEQNVKGFKTSEQALANVLGFKDEARELAGAMVVGRFEDGTPLAVSKVPLAGVVGNDFNFDGDPKGNLCPFNAHIRKTNPRGDVRRRLGNVPASVDRKPIMARRGITYGDRVDDPNDGKIANKPVTGNGLLFMSYQRSLIEQFEFTQQSWANNPNFVNDLGAPLPLTGVDPVMGQGTRADYEWPHPLDSEYRAPAPFAQHVKMLGGEYFFAPSISAIAALGQMPLTS